MNAFGIGEVILNERRASGRTHAAFALSIGRRRDDAYPTRHEAATFEELVDLLDATRTTAKGGVYFCGALSDGHRCKESALAQQWITIDIDGASAPDMQIAMNVLAQIASVQWHTHSHIADSPNDYDHRLRVVVKLSRPCSRDELKRAGAGLAFDLLRRAPSLKFDPSVFRIEQPNYVAPPLTEVRRGHLDAPGLNVEQLIALAPVKPPPPPRAPRAPSSSAKVREAEHALWQLHPDTLPLSHLNAAHRYDGIAIVMFAAQDAGIDFETFDNWCAQGADYPGSEEVDKRWRSVGPGAVGIGTLYSAADQIVPGWQRAYWDGLDAAGRDALKGRTPGETQVNGNMPNDDPTSWQVDEDGVISTNAPIPGPQETPQPPPMTAPKRPPPPQWPEPYEGAMKELVDAMLKSAPREQPQLAVLAALVAMACVCGSGYALKRGGARLNLYGIGVVETTGGKDVPHKAARRLVRLAGGVVLDRPGSTAGLEDALVSRRGMLTSIDEPAGMIASMNDEKNGNYLKELAGLFLRLFSAGNDVHVCRALKAEKRNSGMPAPEVENPAVSMLMFSTLEALTKVMTTGNTTNGFVGRLLFAIGSRNVEMKMEFDELDLSAEIIERARQIAAVNNRDPHARIGMGHIPDFPVRILETDEALDARKLINRRLQGEGESDRSDFGASIRGRHLEIMDRAAGALAVWENPFSPVVTAKHVTWGDSVMVASNAAMREIVGDVWDDQKLREASHVLRLMQKLVNGEIQPPRPTHATDLRNRHVPLSAITLRAKLPSDRLKLALEYLLMADQIRTVRAAPDARRGSLPVLYSLAED